MENTTEGPPEALRKLAEKIEEREQQRPRREQLRRKGRWRNKYRLLRKWEAALEEFHGPGYAKLITGYRPSGGAAPVEVSTIAGLIVWDANDTAHHFRLSRGERATFLEMPDDPSDPIVLDQMRLRTSDPVELPGAPLEVTSRIKALDLEPTWTDVCDDGEHEFVMKRAVSPHGESLCCDECGHLAHVLGWLGHSLPDE